MTSDGPTSEIAEVEPDELIESDPPRRSSSAPLSSSSPAPVTAGAPKAVPAKLGLSVKLEKLRAFYGDAEQVKGVDLDFNANEVTAIIGPSGCGKSTMVRCINRMHEEIPGAHAEGRVLLDDLDVYDSSVDVVSVRRAIGMVFQKPNPFPTMSIFDNVAAGLRLSSRGRGDLHPKVERRRSAPPGCGMRSQTASQSRGRDSRAASSSGCASRARWPWIPR
jgi:phosphate transport system ATP-binding protein